MAAPWERQEGETDPAWEAFALYRGGQPEASLSSVARELGKSQSLIHRWSSRHSWQSRLRAWSVEQDRVARERLLEHGYRRTERHAKVAEAAIEAMLQPGVALMQRIQRMREAGEDPFAGLSMAQLVSVSSTAARTIPQLVVAERLALGLSTENLAVDDRRRADGASAALVSTDADLDRELLGVDTGTSAEALEGEARELVAGEALEP